MCGRFSQGKSARSAFRTWGINPPEGFIESYNITPGSYIAVVRKGSWIPDLMKWGLVPFWSKEPTTKFSTINARMESVGTSPAYRDAFAKRRCLLPVDGFYEWKRLSDGTKWPYFIKLKSRSFFSLACIWDSWKDAKGRELKTCSILTCPPNEVMQTIHNRMPCILKHEDEERFCDPSLPIPEIMKMLQPYDASKMDTIRISTRVNSSSNDDQQIQAPCDPSQSKLFD